MPNRATIQAEVLNAKNAAQDLVRRKYLKQLFEHTKRDTIIYATGFTSKKVPHLPGVLLSITIEDIQGFMASLHGLKGKELDVILHSPGGSLEAAEQVVQYLRSKYDHIRAIIPQNAMSAATMIACACDEIVMGKQSAIGPIDPQITFPTQHGQFTAPAQALLDDFEQAKAEVSANPKVAPLWVSKMRDYPPGIFNICGNTIQLAQEKVRGWLEQFMLRNDPDKAAKAAAISSWLADAHLHKTHGRPINIETAAQIGLHVTPLEADQELQDRVLSVFHATAVTLEITNCIKLIENHDGNGWFISLNTEKK